MTCSCPFKSNKFRLLFGSIIFLLISICVTSWPASKINKKEKRETKVQTQQEQIIYRLEKIENNINIRKKI